MREIIPAIIPKNSADLAEKISIAKQFAPTVQIDIGDGQFVDSKTWPLTDGSPLDLQAYASQIEIEVHLMIEQPENMIRDWVMSGARRIIVHHEATEQFGLIADVVRGAGHELGIALKLETPVSAIASRMDHVRIVQLMGIAKIGFQGHAFETSVLEKVEEVRTIYPEALIEIDGGVTLENVPMLLERGVSRFVVGSAIFGAADPRAAYEQFMSLVQK